MQLWGEGRLYSDDDMNSDVDDDDDLEGDGDGDGDGVGDGDVDDVKGKSCKARMPGRRLGKFLFQSKGFFLPAPPLRLASH